MYILRAEHRALVFKLNWTAFHLSPWWTKRSPWRYYCMHEGNAAPIVVVFQSIWKTYTLYFIHQRRCNNTAKHSKIIDSRQSVLYLKVFLWVIIASLKKVFDMLGKYKYKIEGLQEIMCTCRHAFCTQIKTACLASSGNVLACIFVLEPLPQNFMLVLPERPSLASP